MGEAKRRKKLDSTYGIIPSLTSQNQKQKHVDLIIDELSSQFAREIKDIAAAESMIDGYDNYRQQVSNWLHSKLKLYSESDRTFLASSIMTVYAEISMKYEASPLLIKFWFEILESFLSPEKRDRIASIVQKITREFGF